MLTELSGDPDFVQTKAQHYLAIADAIKNASAELHKIANPDKLISKAVHEVRDKAEDVANKIDKAEGRYRGTSTALITYAIALRQAQGDAHRAILAAGSADDGGYAQSQKDHYETLAQQPGPDQAANQKQLTFWTQKAADVTGDVSKARSDWQLASDAKDAAAKTAASAVSDSYEGSSLEDGFWDHVGDWINKIADALKGICEIAAFLSLFLSWVPILGQVLLAFAILGAVLTLAEAIVKYATGEGSFMAIIGAAVGLVLTAFGGKIFTYLGKLAKMRGISAAMRQGGTVKSLTGLGKGNYLAGAAKDFKSAKLFENPFKMGAGKLTLSNLKTRGLDFATHPTKILGIDKTAFVHGFKPSIVFSSPSMALNYTAMTAYELRGVVGKVQTAINIVHVGDDNQVKLKPF
ncbi:MAG: hypothetical protein JWN36_3072 [Microbacteriaceae bacterium]|nr:hypothetical protein [Microbacteriaceae bacterium]